MKKFKSFINFIPESEDARKEKRQPGVAKRSWQESSEHFPRYISPHHSRNRYSDKPNSHARYSESYRNHEKLNGYSVEDLFFTDVLGDPDNIKYGKPYHYGIPKYYRYGNGMVIGLEPSYRVEKNADDFRRHEISVEKLQPQADTKLSLRAPYSTHVLMSDLDNTEYKSEYPVMGDYVPLEDNKTHNSEIFKPHEITMFEYLSLQQTKYRRLIESSAMHDTEKLWISLLNITKSLNETASPKILNELLLPLYSKAIESNPQSVRLLRGYIKSYTDTAMSNQVIAKLESIAKKHGSQLFIWSELIDAILRSVDYQDMELIVPRLQKVLVLARTYGTDQAILYIIERTANLWKQAGFKELAVGLCQALIVYNFPISKLNLVNSDDLNHYWSSEVSRPGEPSFTMASTIKLEIPKPHIIDNSYNRGLPKRSNKILHTTDDLFEVVLGEDISGFYVKLTKAESMQDLIWVCLRILGINTQYGEWNEINASESFVQELIVSEEFVDNLIRYLISALTQPKTQCRLNPSSNVLLNPTAGEEDIIIWCLDWRYYRSKESVLKAGKSILKSFPTSTRLWAAYLSLEYRIVQDIPMARQLYRTALETLKGSRDVYIMAWQWIKFEWTHGYIDECQGIIDTLFEKDNVYSQLCEVYISTKSSSPNVDSIFAYVGFIKCIHEILNSRKNESPIFHIQNFISVLDALLVNSTRTLQSIELMRSLCQIWTPQRVSMNPSTTYFKECIKLCITKFPEQTEWLLASYLKYDTYSVSVWSLLDSLTDKDDDESSKRNFALLNVCEKYQKETQKSLFPLSYVRTLYKECLSSLKGSLEGSLWRRFAHIQLKSPSTQIRYAEIMVQAIEKCWWFKLLYDDILSISFNSDLNYLNGTNVGISSSQKRTILLTAIDRGIRSYGNTLEKINTLENEARLLDLE